MHPSVRQLSESAVSNQNSLIYSSSQRFENMLNQNGNPQPLGIIELEASFSLQGEIRGVKDKKKAKKQNIQQQVFAGGHPPNY